MARRSHSRNHSSASWRRRANVADWLYLLYFVGLGILILLFRDRVPGWRGYLALHVIGTAIVVGLALGSQRFTFVHAWYPVVMPLLMFQEIAQLNFLLVDGWRDAYLLRLEAWFFPEPPTVWLSRDRSWLVTDVLAVGYLSYYVMLIIVGGALYRRTDRSPFYGVMAASVLSYMICYAVFLTFPTEGPAHTLRHLHTEPIAGGPFHSMVRFIQRAGVHGNAFPSAHVAGAVVPLIFAWRYAPTLASWLSPLVVLLSVAAVYDRYHYASDVVAGIIVGGAAAGLVLFGQARPLASSTSAYSSVSGAGRYVPW